jgi:hypothetical protein
MTTIEGKLVVDSDGKSIGEVETVTKGLITIVRGVMRIERAQVMPDMVAVLDENRVVLKDPKTSLQWKDIGVRCENCGNYVERAKFEMGHYFCSRKCKEDFVANFQTKFARGKLESGKPNARPSS